ncbi:acyl-coenzyme A thioesterase 11 isoform X4 [Carettochelys insculpta]|uniref:acyl-coenzyme A thioesterase 11 isoform X4 n=1 Tax=Carettochelys insculpta TaxID=44489 RepID=UPI003EBA77E3
MGMLGSQKMDYQDSALSAPSGAPADPALAMETGQRYRNPTEVQMSQLVLPSHTNHRGELSIGQLLKWIDTAACLSAERHAGCPCVTASVDDIYFEHTIRQIQIMPPWQQHGKNDVCVGQVVNIKAKVNRAFNSSMEVGIQVSHEDLSTGKQWNVCKAYATFVAQGKATSKMKLKPLAPQTEEEKMEYGIAAERRRMRVAHTETLKNLLTNSTIQTERENGECSTVVPAEKTRVESVELVLPPHANHQGNTFGGQIMAWMENVATIAASRLCHAHPTLKTIEMFHFRGPSQVGDRLLLKAIVNNAFKNSMEVGVCVEAYQQEMEVNRRHINSAFMTFVVLDQEGQPITLPVVKPEAGDGERRYREASARKKIRLDRKYIISCEQTKVPLSVPWDQSNKVYLSYNNVFALKTLVAKTNWVLATETDKVRMYMLEEDKYLSFRIEMTLCIDALQAFSLLSDLRQRHEWDHYYADPYVIAFRSVTLPTCPPNPDYTRGETMCSGFCIWQETTELTKVSYYNQAAPGYLTYVTTNIAGLSSDFYVTFKACERFLQKNKEDIAVGLQNL